MFGYLTVVHVKRFFIVNNIKKLNGTSNRSIQQFEIKEESGNSIQIMGRSRSRTPSRKKSHRRSSSRSKHSKKSRHRTPERKSSKYRHRSESSSDSSSYKSSSKYQNKRRQRSRSQSRRKHRRSTSSSSQSNSSSRSSRSHRSSSTEKHRNKPSSNYMEKIRSMRTPTPPPSKLNFDASMEFLDKRHVSESFAEINANEFRPKTFSSAANSKGEKSDTDILKVKGEVRAVKTDTDDDPLFHQKVFGDDDARMEQWVHRLYTYRQKMFASSN